MGHRSLKEKIKDFFFKIPDFEKSVEAIYKGRYSTLHFAIFALDIEISPDDLKLAAEKGIRIVSDEKFDEWAKVQSIGVTTMRYQVMEFFHGAKLPIKERNGKPFRFPGFRTRIGGTEDFLLTFAASPQDLMNLSFVYRLSVDDIKGYQRPLKTPKLRNINKFLCDPHNGFPNSLLVTFDEDSGRKLGFEPLEGGPDDSVEIGSVVIPPFYGIAEVIDGQHRLFGYFDFSKDSSFASMLAQRRQSDRLLVVAYPDPRGSERPNLFLTINSNQTRINIRQIYALMARSRPRSQIGYIARLVIELNSRGPLENRLEIPGMTRGKRRVNIANLGKGIKDRRLVDNSSRHYWNLFGGPRDMESYPEAVDDRTIKALQDFFAAVRDAHRDDWLSRTGFLCSNNGLNVMLRVYVEILKFYRHGDAKRAIRKESILRLLKPTLREFVDGRTSARLLAQTSNEYGRENIAADLMERIRRRHRGFASTYLRERTRAPVGGAPRVMTLTAGGT